MACLLSAVLAATVAYFVWQYRPKAGAQWLTVTQTGITLWGLGQGLGLLFTPPWLVLGWYSVSLVGMLVTAIGWLFFAVRYAGQEGVVTPVRTALLWAPVPVLVVLAAVNPADVVYVDPHVTATGEFVTGWGPAALTIFGYGYLTNLAGEVFLLRKAVRSRNIYRRRTAFFLVSGFVVLLGHVVSLTGWSPFPHFVLVPTVSLAIWFLSVAILYNDRVLNLLPLAPLLRPLGKRFGTLAPLARDAVIEEMGSGVLVLDGDNRVVDLNPTARRLLDAEGNRIVGTAIGDYVDTDVFLGDELPFLDPSVTEGTFSNVWVEYRDGTCRCYDVVITDLEYSKAGETTGRVAIIHDVTTAQRQKQQLEAQKRELERQNEQLDEFAGIVSHDLRNPLNVAEGRIDVARDTGDLDHLQTAETALGRMEDLIDDVLRLARQGRSIDDTETVELAAVAEQAWRTVATAEASLELDVPSAVTLEADPTRLQQLLENLFRNAVEHGSTGPPSQSSDDAVQCDDQVVTIRVRSLEEPGGLFVVADDGPGITEAKRDVVLEQGYTTSDDGTGFGLSIVSTIAGAHGWEVSVEESPEGGAQFRFTDTQPTAGAD